MVLMCVCFIYLYDLYLSVYSTLVCLDLVLTDLYMKVLKWKCSYSNVVFVLR